jgi:predicted RNA-binding protein
MPRLHERGASSKPVHILGIADTESIPKLVAYGADTFDSCYPTRVGRHGSMLTANGPLRVVSQPSVSITHTVGIGWSLHWGEPACCPQTASHGGSFILG